MDAKEKLNSRYKLGLTIQKIVSANDAKNEIDLVTSLRKLAAASETEYAIIQRISSIKKDPQFTTLAAIIDGFGITFSEFARVYDSIPDEDIEEYKRNIKKQSRSDKEKSKEKMQRKK